MRGWGQFCTRLKYKAEWSGKIYREVDRFFRVPKLVITVCIELAKCHWIFAVGNVLNAELCTTEISMPLKISEMKVYEG
jgi:hypothetical protein